MHPKPSPSFVTPRVSPSRLMRTALLGVAALSLLGLLSDAPAARAAAPTITAFSWSGPASGEAQVTDDVTIRLVYGVAGAASGNITITAPPDTYIRSVAPAIGSTGASWSVTYNRTPNSDPWQTSATLTASGTSSNFSGTLDIVFTSRNGAFVSGGVVTFGAAISATNLDGTSNDAATYDIRLLSAPSIATATTGQPQETYFGTYAGELGTFKTTRFYTRESGNGRADAGTTATITLPSPAKFIAATPIAATVPWVIGSTPAAGSSGVVTATYGLARGIAQALTATGGTGAVPVSRQDSAYLAVTYFVPCSAIPVGGQVPVTVSATAYQAGSSAPYDRTSTSSYTVQVSAASCNAGSLAKSLTSSGTSAVPGETLSYYMYATTPMVVGSFPTNVVLVDRLPDAVTYTDAEFRDSPYSTSFTLYLCAATSYPGSFDFASFDALRSAATSGEHCRTQASFLTTATAADVTHVVAYAAEWKDPSYTAGEFGIRTVWLGINAQVDGDVTSGSYVNRMCVHGAPVGASTPWVGGFAASYTACSGAGGPPAAPTGCGQACFSMTNSTTPALELTVRNANNSGAPYNYNRGEIAEIYVTAYRSANANLLFDPAVTSNTVRIQVPPGFDVLTAEQLTPCVPDVVIGGPEFSATLTPNSSGTLVSFVPQQVLSVTGCGTINGSLATKGFKITARVSSSYPFVQNAVYPTDANFNVSNSSLTPLESRDLFVAAPSELDLELAGTSCTQTAIGATATFTNQGGDLLDDVVLDLAIPVGATFASAGTPTFYDTAALQSVATASSVSYLVGGSYQGTLPPDLADVDGVRLTVPDLSPYVRGDWPVFFTATLNQPSYLFEADIADLAGHTTNDAQLFDTTGCPCTINIDKTFVPAGSVAAPMQGVQFLLEGPFGYAITHTTNASGAINVSDLAPGNYTLTEVVPTMLGGAVVAAPFDGSWSQTFAVTAQQIVDIDATNACTCPDEPCVDEGTCSWDAATASASCSSTPTVCGVGVCGEQCDPDLDQCVAAEPVPCDQPGGRVIWGSLIDADGTEKLFKCTVISAGAPPTCETDPDTGVLVTYEIEAGLCAE